MRTLLWFSLASLVVIGAVTFAAGRVAEPARASAVVAAVVICLASGVIALIPPALIAPRYPTYMIEAGLGAMVIRLLMTLSIGAVYLKWYAPARAAFMGAMVCSYLLILAVETGVTMRLVKRYWQPPKSA